MPFVSGHANVSDDEICAIIITTIKLGVEKTGSIVILERFSIMVRG
jgi:hypothetical protein